MHANSDSNGEPVQSLSHWLLDWSSGLKEIYIGSEPEKGICKLVIIAT